ncbi:MAG: NUDIX domain-containing protein [bacterium]|nr:NUDIX domain-containing protein [bacterium]
MAAPTVSAGILLYRWSNRHLEVLIAHPGGPFWANRDKGAWSLPKGLVDVGEAPREAAKREFEEETGHELPPGEMLDLGEVVLRSGKRVVAWAVAGTLDAATAHSNTVWIEWPKGSGIDIEIPEVDEFRWCDLAKANTLLNQAQAEFLPRLQKMLDHAE